MLTQREEDTGGSVVVSHMGQAHYPRGAAFLGWGRKSFINSSQIIQNAWITKFCFFSSFRRKWVADFWTGCKCVTWPKPSWNNVHCSCSCRWQQKLIMFPLSWSIDPCSRDLALQEGRPDGSLVSLISLSRFPVTQVDVHCYLYLSPSNSLFKS